MLTKLGALLIENPYADTLYFLDVQETNISSVDMLWAVNNISSVHQT